MDQLAIGISSQTITPSGRFRINYYYPGAFEIHSLYVWNAELSNAQMKVVTGALRAQIGGAPDITTTEKGDPVVAMAPSPTAYEQTCPSGNIAMDGDCTCAVDMYYDGTACVSCPTGTTAPMNTAPIEDCVCLAGYSALSDGVQCIPCAAGTWKGSTGIGVCIACPEFSTSLEGSALCTCFTGYDMQE